jgi:hypothetical protein
LIVERPSFPRRREPIVAAVSIESLAVANLGPRLRGDDGRYLTKTVAL